MIIRNCLGRIASVSMLERSRGTTVLSSWVKACMLVPLEIADIGEVAGDGRRRCHDRADQVRTTTGALAAFEVAVRGRSAALALAEAVFVHAQAHRAAGVAPFEAGIGEDAVQALGFRL